MRFYLIGGLFLAALGGLYAWNRESVRNALQDAALDQIEATDADREDKERLKEDVADDTTLELINRLVRGGGVRPADSTGD